MAKTNSTAVATALTANLPYAGSAFEVHEDHVDHRWPAVRAVIDSPPLSRAAAIIEEMTMQIIDQSALAQSLAATGLDLSADIIVRMPCAEIAEYQGTRTALEAEGIIPEGTVWPNGFDRLYWSDDKFTYWLGRNRPEGVKGPRKQLLYMDWWMFRCSPVKVQSCEAKTMEEKSKALASEIYRQSPNGRAECDKQWNAYMEARRDDKFQAFKALIPGIIRPKRGCRRKNTEQAKGASA